MFDRLHSQKINGKMESNLRKDQWDESLDTSYNTAKHESSL